MHLRQQRAWIEVKRVTACVQRSQPVQQWPGVHVSLCAAAPHNCMRFSHFFNCESNWVEMKRKKT
jgi:hypothetical protein